MSKPKLYLFVGYPGAGKTTVAKIIADAKDAVHIWSDVERHKLFPNPTHSEEESVKLYDELNRRADELLAGGKSVVYDTNFNFKTDRQKLKDIADKHDADAVIVWVNTPLEVARKRAVNAPISRNGYRASMSGEQFDAIAAKLEPPTKNEKVIKINGAKLDGHELMTLLSY